MVKPLQRKLHFWHSCAVSANASVHRRRLYQGGRANRPFCRPGAACLGRHLVKAVLEPGYNAVVAARDATTVCNLAETYPNTDAQGKDLVRQEPAEERGPLAGPVAQDARHHAAIVVVEH